MNYTIQQNHPNTYLECQPGLVVHNEAAALDLVALCGENGVQRILLHAENLPLEFYNLKTGLAGRILLKWTTYWIKAALVLPAEMRRNGRFAEFAWESSINREFRIFSDRQSAETWLIND